MPIQLQNSVKTLPGVGPVLEKKLEKLGIHIIADLLFYLPVRYEDFSKITPIAEIKLGEKICVAGKILEIEAQRTWKKKMFITQAVIQDNSGAVKAIWFGQPYLAKTLQEGDEILLAGKATLGKNGIFLQNPIYEKIGSDLGERSDPETIHTGRIIPIYPETEGLTSRWLRFLLKPLLDKLKNALPETLPQNILQEQGFLEINQALQQAHFPDTMALAQKAKERFSFEELLLVELAVLKQRVKLNQQSSPSIPTNVDLIKKFLDNLPFVLTDAQRKCTWQILKDIERSRPMSRLLEGDVGSGKTVVALIACLNTVRAGWQTAIMAPTEILAKQHFVQASKVLAGLKVRIALLTGKDDKIISQKLVVKKGKESIPEILEISKQKIMEKTAKGEIDLLIGTHSLIQDKIKFQKLALAVVDEQHRFGVEQRARLLQNAKCKMQIGKNPAQSTICNQQFAIPHLLSMTATPIPRTLALTVYGDLDLSLLDQMPMGRKKVITKVVAPEKRQWAYEFIKKEVEKGNQVFVICPRIEKSEILNSPWSEVKAVKEEFEKLSKKVFLDLKVTMLHGKMPAKEKERVMKNFRDKKFDILVSTSVVEVGVDVPGATVMMIEGADRFGLAQLHQFRGRVGRSDKQSYCFLFSDSPSRTTYKRLRALVKCQNGFELAQKDMEIRGPGSLFGAKQWGLPDLAMQNLTDLALVEKTRETAKEILTYSPDLKKYPALWDRVRTLEQKMHLE